MNIIQEVGKEMIRRRPKIKPGDIVAVHQEIEESGKKRTQIFKGVILKVQGSGATKTFTVRRISLGVGIEKIFPLYLPSVKKIQVLKSTHVRRAKLYYLREKTGKAAKLKEKAVSDEVVKFLEEEDRSEKEEIKKAKEADKTEKVEEAK